MNGILDLKHITGAVFLTHRKKLFRIPQQAYGNGKMEQHIQLIFLHIKELISGFRKTLFSAVFN
jgi:hypothetical protein